MLRNEAPVDDWRQALPADERGVYASSGFGQVTEPGPALAVVIVDVTYGFLGHQDLSDDENQRRYPSWCGPEAWSAVGPIRSVATAATQRGLPVVQTVGVPAGDPRSPWPRKHGRRENRQDDDVCLIEELRSSRARTLTKFAPSAFFGTDLAESLREHGVTDLLVCGCTTSGCVRATAVDAFSHGFGTFVVSDAVFDRAATSHAVSLFELNQKYATVISLEQAHAAVRRASRPIPGDLLH